MIFATAFFALPGDSYAQKERRNKNTYGQRDRRHGIDTYRDRTYSQSRWEKNRRGRGRWNRRHRNTYGYRNYGQYRRTQVGNRRFRTVKRYYWNDGVRLSRLVRVYY